MRIFWVPVLLFPLLCGCGQLLSKVTVTPNQKDSPTETVSPQAADSSATAAAGADQPTPHDPSAVENSTQTTTLDNLQPSPDNADKTTDVTKKSQSILDEALDFCQVSQDFWQKGELENALEALDQAYSLILNVDTLDNPKLIQQKEDLRFMISKRILEIYASRNIVVNGNHNAIPMVMNKYIEAEMKRFETVEKSFFMESYERSGLYRPMIVAALKESGLPLELSWLPLIESGYKVNALSRARALGLWQFIPSTGYKFGLKRDKYIDERIDPFKSTQAAIEYLKELHQIFGDWTTVLAAYNCGEGQVLRIIRNQNINYLDNFWDLYELLPQETARYVPRFMATLHMIKKPKEYGLDSVTVHKPLKFEVVTVAKQAHLKNIAQAIDVSEKELYELNPELRYRILPQDNYPLRVPPAKSKLLLAKLDQIPISSPPQPAYIHHRVRSGESLSTIAEKYRTSVRSIARANKIHKKDFIRVGQKLKIPRRGTVVYSSRPYDKPLYEIPEKYVVKSGDSLWILAKRYRTTTKEIQELNLLKTTNLSIGQVLKIPGGKQEILSGETLKTYEVKRGDSPFQIAQRHKMSLERFLRINRLTPRSKIYPGQRLYVE